GEQDHRLVQHSATQADVLVLDRSGEKHVVFWRDRDVIHRLQRQEVAHTHRGRRRQPTYRELPLDVEVGAPRQRMAAAGQRYGRAAQEVAPLAVLRWGY